MALANFSGATIASVTSLASCHNFERKLTSCTVARQELDEDETTRGLRRLVNDMENTTECRGREDNLEKRVDIYCCLSDRVRKPASDGRGNGCQLSHAPTRTSA